MNRLQKKCFIVSAGFHSLLLLILLVGPAFFSPKARMDDLPPLYIIPSRIIDGVPNPGANPSVKLPAPAPPPPPLPAAQSPPKARDPEPPKDVVKNKERDPDSLEADREPRKHEIKVSTKPVVRKPNSPTTSKEPSETDNRARELADARQRAKDLLGKTVNSLRTDLSQNTTVELPPGFGEAVASYAQIVKSKYELAWLPPDDTASDDAITKVTVTIASDGNVVSAQILRASGDSMVDRSVQRTLDRVTFIAPFPKGATDKERTYTINFNLRAKRALG